jgi:hypothetical protein
LRPMANVQTTEATPTSIIPPRANNGTAITHAIEFSTTTADAAIPIHNRAPYPLHNSWCGRDCIFLTPLSGRRSGARLWADSWLRGGYLNNIQRRLIKALSRHSRTVPGSSSGKMIGSIRFVLLLIRDWVRLQRAVGERSERHRFRACDRGTSGGLLCLQRSEWHRFKVGHSERYDMSGPLEQIGVSVAFGGSFQRVSCGVLNACLGVSA